MSDEEEFEDALEELPTPKGPRSAPASSVSKKFKFKKSFLKRSRSVNGSDKREEKKGGRGEEEDEREDYYVGHDEDEETERPSNTLSLEESLSEARRAIDLFLNNRFDEARDIVGPMCDQGIYHALGYGVFMYLKAVMTFEQKHIEEASVVLSHSCEVINSFRNKKGRGGVTENLGRILRKEDYNAYSETELHAEICYAEALLLKAILTVCEDESLVSFFNAGFKLKACYSSYRNCVSILEERDWNSSKYKDDFESGVRMGSGIFNILISLLPGKIMKVLKFVGLHADKESGFEDIMSVYQDRGNIRQFLACLVLLGYHLVIDYFLGGFVHNVELCREILDQKLVQYPNGVFFLFFQGRYYFTQGDITNATKFYQKSVDSQNEWPQFHHVCYWELFWATSFRRDWTSAILYANKLYKESKWSKCFYAYQKAAILCMIQDDLTPDQVEDQIELMKNVPNFKQKLGGKSLPMEKFAICKAERFLKQNNCLLLPVLELIYVWNGFKIISKDWNLLEPFYVLIEREMKKLENNRDEASFYNENFCLLTLLKGMCLKHMKSPYGAEECFETVSKFAGKLNDDLYLIPYALAERGFLLHELGQGQKALQYFESAKTDFKAYQLQSRLHFRIHNSEREIKKNKTS